MQWIGLKSLVPKAPAFYRAYSQSSASIETVRLAYDLYKPRQEATSAPIVFLHGLFGSKVNNRSVGKALGRDLGKDVYCLDLRNHGDSPHNETHNYLSMAADVRRFILDHNLEQPIVIGHSMGARAAMALALKWPDLVSKLIPVDNGPVGGRLSSDFPNYILGMKEVDRSKVTSQKDAYEIMSKYEKNAIIQQFLLSNFKRTHQHYYHSRIPLDILGKSLDYIGEFDFPASQYRFTKPTLLIRGTESKFVPDEQLPLMGELFPRFTVKDIKAGHWVISENPNEFIRIVEEFLDDKE